MPSPSPLPLVIGFTGHREFRDEDVPRIEAKVREIFTSLQSKYPSTPITLMTSLAEGADRIGAYIAIEMGIECIAPLPMKPEIYLDDFIMEESRQEFHDLLSKCSRWFTMPLAEGVTEEAIMK